MRRLDKQSLGDRLRVVVRRRLSTRSLSILDQSGQDGTTARATHRVLHREKLLIENILLVFAELLDQVDHEHVEQRRLDDLLVEWEIVGAQALQVFFLVKELVLYFDIVIQVSIIEYIRFRNELNQLEREIYPKRSTKNSKKAFIT